MTPPLIKTIRRLALTAAVVVALILAGSYGWRRWRAFQARKAMTVAIPSDVRQQAEKFTFSRSEGGQTLFSVEASRTIERAGKTTILEDVVAVIYGREGDRTDEIRSRRCEYDAGNTGDIYCPGEVTIDLAGQGRDRRAVPGQSVRIVTTGMHFDPKTGVAWTEDSVQFRFPEGAGRAVGLRYQPRAPGLRLQEQVKIRLSGGSGTPILIQGSELLYYARGQALVLRPPLSLQTEDRTLVADRIRMEMDEDFRTRRILATGNVRGRGRQDGHQLSMRAPRAVALYAADGTLERLKANGGVVFVRHGADSRETLSCRQVVLDFDRPGGRVERVVARGDAELVVWDSVETRELRAPILELSFADGGQDRQVLTARQRGTLTLIESSGERRSMEANHIQLHFREKMRLRRVAASGRVETTAARSGGPPQRTWSKELRASFDEAGKLTEAEQWGTFRYQGGQTQAEAGRASYGSASETYVLTQEPVVWDATTRTTARVIEVEQHTGLLRAEGEVRTTRQSANAPEASFGSGQPVNLAAERLRAERERGWARYEGSARMWEGENRLAAASIELFRSAGKLVAEGEVAGLFLESSKADSSSPKPEPRRAVNVTAQRFTYWEAEQRGLFEGEVTAWDGFGRLTAPRLEIFLQGGEAVGGQRIERAHAEGGVLIKQPSQQASSEQADYHAEAQTVVLSGGRPTITDARGSSVTGAQLTLFLTDGRIRVDSGKGERTITRRPPTR